MPPATTATAPKTAPGVGVGRAKNRAWGFFEDGVRHTWKIDPQVVETYLEMTTAGSKTAPGVPHWPSRDPIGERGGLNLYGFGFNNPASGWDLLGRNWFTDLIPIVGPIVNLVFPPPGTDAEDYDCNLDLDACQDNPDAEELRCRQDVHRQLMANLLSAVATGTANGLLDVLGALAIPAAVPVFAADAALEIVATGVNVVRITKAGEAFADSCCRCVLVNCKPNTESYNYL